MSCIRIAARYFDGCRAAPQAVILCFDECGVSVSGAAGEHRFQADDFVVSEAMGAGPRSLFLKEGGSFEVSDLAGLALGLQQLGGAESGVVRWQHSWRRVGLALILVLCVVFSAYRWGLPAVSKALAARLPAGIAESISVQTLSMLDQHLLQPSALPPARQAGLQARAQHLFDGQPAWRLHFRASSLGPNALALPNGDIVVFDSLVALAPDDAGVIAVLAHELGHVAQRHGLRQLIQSSVVGVVAGLYFGDLSSLLSALAVGVLESGYSRDFEREADAYAVVRLRAQGEDPMALAGMLQALQAAHGEGRGEDGGSWLSSHPETAVRIALIEAAAKSPQ